MANTKVKAEQLEAAQTNITSVGTLTGLALSGSLTGTSATFTTSDNTSQLTLTSTDADANVGPRFDLKRDSGTPEASDMLGQIRFLGDDDAGNALSYAHMSTYIDDTTDGAEDGKSEIDVRHASTSRSRLKIDSSATVFNEDSVDVDFRIESNNKTGMFFVDAGNNRIGVGTSSPTQMLALDDSVAGEVAVKIQNDSTNSSAFASLYLQGQGNNFRIKNWGDGTSKANITEFVSTAGSSEFLFTPAASEKLVLNSTGLYPYADAGLELGDSNNRWNRLEVKSTTSGNIAFVGEDTSAAGSFRTVEVYTTLSGSDATGADVANYGIYNQIDSSATGGDTSDEHRVYGMRNIVKVTGDSDIVYGGYNQAEAEHSSGQVTNLYGAYNYAVADTNSGATVTNLYGAYNYGLAQGSSGSTITNVYAGYNKAITTGADDIGHNTITACYAEIENDDSGQENTITTGYLYRGNYDDDSGNNTKYTNFYGLHIGGSSLSGNMTGSGNSAGVYLDLAGADVGFWNSEDQLNYFRGSLAIASGSKNVANTVGMELHLVEPQGGDMILARNDSATTTNEVLGRIFFGATENSGSTVNYGASIESYAGGPHSASDSEGYLVFKTTPNSSTTLTESFRIRSDGNISLPSQVATGSLPQARLEVVAAASGNCINTQVTTAGNYTCYGGSGPTTSGGNVYHFARMINSQGSQVGEILVSHSGTSYVESSDYRLKENVTGLTDAIARIKQLQPKRFNFIEVPDKTVDGFLAHEVSNIVPEAVTREKDAVDADGNPEYQGIDKSKLVPLLVAAVQEQQALIETLSAEVAALKGG